MSMTFEAAGTGTIKAKAYDSTTTYSIKGINSNVSDVEDTADQINKILDIVGIQIAGDEYMTLTVIKEAYDN